MKTLSNYSLAIFLINDDVQAVRCAYETEGSGEHERPASGKLYTFKTFDKTLKKGDIVIVPTDTRVGFTCVKVWETNVDVDFNASYDMKWIVGKADPSHYEMIRTKESEAVEIVKAAEKKRMRDELRKDVMGYHESTVTALRQITFNGDGPALSEDAAASMVLEASIESGVKPPEA